MKLTDQTDMFAFKALFALKTKQNEKKKTFVLTLFALFPPPSKKR